MTCLYLIRHGEVEGNRADAPTFVGWEDKPLTARGLAQAQAVARRLQDDSITAIYASDLQRAAVMGQCIAEASGVSVHLDADWRELNYGEWEGLSESEIVCGWPQAWSERAADPWNIRVPGGESLALAWERWRQALQKLLDRHRTGESLVLVAHNGTLRCLLCHFLGAPLTHYRRIVLDNGGLSCVDVQHMENASPQYKIRYLNETQYLKGI